jgi:hypothetical protein
MGIRLAVREVAERRGLNLATFQREAKLGVSTARRFWYSTADGSPSGRKPLTQVDLRVLEQVARFLEVTPGELLVMMDYPGEVG